MPCGALFPCSCAGSPLSSGRGPPAGARPGRPWHMGSHHAYDRRACGCWLAERRMVDVALLPGDVVPLPSRQWFCPQVARGQPAEGGGDQGSPPLEGGAPGQRWPSPANAGHSAKPSLPYSVAPCSPAPSKFPQGFDIPDCLTTMLNPTESEGPCMPGLQRWLACSRPDHAIKLGCGPGGDVVDNESDAAVAQW